MNLGTNWFGSIQKMVALLTRHTFTGSGGDGSGLSFTILKKEAGHFTVNESEVGEIIPDTYRWRLALDWGQHLRLLMPLEDGVDVVATMCALEDLLGGQIMWTGDKYVDLALLINAGCEAGLITFSEELRVKSFLARYELA